mgnify:CR=1 FL=1
MEENKILEILKKVPLGAELYSPAFGKMNFNGIRNVFNNEQRIDMLVAESKIDMAFLTDGKFRKSGEIMLFPSDKMRNWDKLAWEKGDVLVSNEGDCCIFTEFLDYPYTTFLAKLVLCKETVKSNTFVEETRRWEKADKTTEKYIEYINTKLEGSNRIVNPKTLEVEIWKFNDGDILTCPPAPLLSINSSTFILKERAISGYLYHAALNGSKELYISTGNTWCGRDAIVRYATEEEKTKLFDALAKEGKRWNAEKKVIEDIKPKPKKENTTHKKVSYKLEHEFQPFEKVLARDVDTGEWHVDLYGLKNENEPYPYWCVGGSYVYCIPYEGNEHLLGTTNNPD